MVGKRKRRSRGEGTVRQRADGTYEAREPREVVPRDQKPRSFYARTEREAIRKLRIAIRERQEGISPEAKKQMLADYLERWLEGPLKQAVSTKTHADYAWIVKKHLIPAIGDMKLAELTAEDLDELYAAKSAEGLSSRTVHYIHSTIRVALQRAVKKRLVPYNVARDADPPPLEPTEEAAPLSEEELKAFFATAAETGDRFKAFFVAAALVAARPGEILGLKWSDLTLPEEKGELGLAIIRRTVSLTGGRVEIRERTKAGRGRNRRSRAVDLLPPVVASLHSHRKRQLEERIRLAKGWQDLDLVFPNQNGGPMHRDNLSKRHFKPLLEKAGLPSETRLYDLRHTFSTLWRESGEPLEILQSILGHTRFSVTADHYVHFTPAAQREAMKRFGERFS